MRHEIPAELDALLAASSGTRRDEAWAAFVQRHSRLILHVARSRGGDRDTVMDRYAHILERLNADDHRRLRTWVNDRRSKFTTWLTVVAQRMSLDLYRQRYGRPRDNDKDAAESRAVRRRLVDLLADELLEEQAAPVDNSGEGAPESAIRVLELRQRLLEAVAELSSADQLLLALRFRDSLSAAEIARAVGYPNPFHVYRQLERLMLTLRESLARRGVVDSTP